MGDRGWILTATFVAIGIAQPGATHAENPRREAKYDKGKTVACKEYQGISTKLHVCDPDSVLPGTCLTFCGHEMIGEAYFADGFYVGKFRYRRPDGHGTLREVGNKWTYEGLFVRGHREGEGTIEFADGLGWKGKWVADAPRGIGQWFIVGVGPLDQDTYERRPSADRVKKAREPKSVAPPPPPRPRSAPAVSPTPAPARAFAPAPLALPSTASAEARAAIEQAYAVYVQAATAATDPEARGKTLDPFARVVFAKLPPRPDGLALVAAQVHQLFESDFEAGFTSVIATYLPSGVSAKELADAGRPARFEGCLTRRARWTVDAFNKKADAGPRPICAVR